jgi:glycosyltransferase involved in cell wall biosynthesis
MNPLVSILITSYNKAGTIQRAIESALAQTYQPIEIIVVDDGSAGSITHAILNQYVSKVRVFRNSHQGMMATFRYGFLLCNGDYIATLDADDYWPDTEKIEKQLNIFKSDPRVGLIAQSTKPGLKNVTFDTLLRGNPLCASTMIFKSDTFRFHCDFDKWTRWGFITQDYPILLEFTHNSKIHVQPEVFHGYTFCDESVSQTKRRWRRLNIVLRVFLIKAYFILRYGCKPQTLLHVTYRITRDLLSVILKRWHNSR